MEIACRQVRRVPDLLRDQPDPLGEFFQRAQIRAGIPSSGNFVVPALADQQRPRTSHSPILMRPAVISLAVAVMIVAAPAGAEGGIYLEHRIDDPQRILNDRVVRATNTVTNQLEKT